MGSHPEPPANFDVESFIMILLIVLGIVAAFTQ